MDSHFNEYLAAIAGMQDLYGVCRQETTEFHEYGGETAIAEFEPVAVEA
jgi:hypothetical protein